MAYLISVWDSNVSATDSYMLTEKNNVEELVNKAVKDYLWFLKDDVKDLEGLIKEHISCPAQEEVESFKKPLLFELELEEENLEEYGFDTNEYFPLVGGSIIKLENNPKFNEFCKSLDKLEPEKLVSGEDFFPKYCEEVQRLYEMMEFGEE